MLLSQEKMYSEPLFANSIQIQFQGVYRDSEDNLGYN
jgi:hypothetical protein